MDQVLDEDELRPCYDFSKLRRVNRVGSRRVGAKATASEVESLNLTGAFPFFEDDVPPGFEWDTTKATSNYKKHGVTFNEASTVFDNRLAVTVYDPDHSEKEDRYLTIADSARNRMLVVSHTDREDHTRIISARLAEPSERRDYENGTFS
jgi:hypothetical protein